jgi:putative endonuclease
MGKNRQRRTRTRITVTFCSVLSRQNFIYELKYPSKEYCPVTNRPSTKTIGSMAENNTCLYLESHGLKLIERNFRCDAGEIDLIMQEHEILVFIEVRFRQYKDFGQSIETISASKKQRLIKTATVYLQKNNLLDKIACRFDVIGVGKSEEFIWIRNAFDVKY